MANIKDGNAFVAGRSRDTVRRLLALADELKIDQTLVQTRSGGYEVPAKIADAYEKGQADAAKPSTPKTSAAKKAPAKGTRSKKATSA